MADSQLVIYLILGAVVVVVATCLRIYIGKLPKTCSACGQRKLVEQYKKPTGNVAIDTYDGGSSQGGGTQTSVRVIYDVKYKCQNCGEEVAIRQTRV